MSEAVIVAIITGACAVIAQLIISARSTAEIYARLDKQSEVADTKIHGEIAVIKSEVSALRQEVQKHNNLIERTYKLEQDVAVHEEKIKVANNRIGDLEKHTDG